MGVVYKAGHQSQAIEAGGFHEVDNVGDLVERQFWIGLQEFFQITVDGLSGPRSSSRQPLMVMS